MEKKEAVKKWYEAQWTKLLYIILPMVGIGLFNLAKDIFTTGTEVKTSELIVKVVTSDRDIDDHFKSIIKEELVTMMKNPAIWATALGSSFVKEYAQGEIDNIRTEFREDLNKIDSAMNARVSSVMSVSGFRDEEYEKILGSMMRWYVDKHLEKTSLPAF